MKKVRLTIEDRILIEELLRQNYNLKDIARVIGVYPSTISREIKSRRKGNKEFNICNKTNRYPFICFNCSKKVHCNKRKYYYNYKEAQKDYENKLKYSRIGIDMSIDEVEYWNDYFKDKIKDRNQPILHIFKNIENEFPKSIQSFYKYVHKGYFSSINDEMLARSFSYKPRNKKETVKTITKDNIIKKGRRMIDFEDYINKNPKANIVEMDTVIGKFEDDKCIMTLYFRTSKLMLMFFIKKYKPSEITKIFNSLRKIEKLKTTMRGKNVNHYLFSTHLSLEDKLTIIQNFYENDAFSLFTFSEICIAFNISWKILWNLENFERKNKNQNISKKLKNSISLFDGIVEECFWQINTICLYSDNCRFMYGSNFMPTDIEEKNIKIYSKELIRTKKNDN